MIFEQVMFRLVAAAFLLYHDYHLFLCYKLFFPISKHNCIVASSAISKILLPTFRQDEKTQRNGAKLNESLGCQFTIII